MRRWKRLALMHSVNAVVGWLLLGGALMNGHLSWRTAFIAMLGIAMMVYALFGGVEKVLADNIEEHK